MTKRYKPDGYNSISPYLVVIGAQKMIDLLQDIFRAVELRKYKLPDGSIVHAEIKIDDSVVMLADASEKYPPNQLLLHVYVPDVDKTFDKAVAARCEVVGVPVRKQEEPDKRGSFRDFSGNVWSVSTQMSNE